MKSFIISFLLSLCVSLAYCDSIPLKSRVDDLERNLKQIDANQLNYKIEKDLLKEAYSVNYERINLSIAAVLGLFTILGFFGFRGIKEIQKEYADELAELKRVKNEFDVKAKEIDIQKIKYETGLEAIIMENQEQNSKIKFIELKDKAVTLFEAKNYDLALDFANTALDIMPEDIKLLTIKARILSYSNQYQDAIKLHKKSLLLQPDDFGILRNLTECLYLANGIDEAKQILATHPDIFADGDLPKVLNIFKIIEAYYSGQKEALLDIVKSYVTVNNLNDIQTKPNGWSLEEVKYFAHNQPTSDMKVILQNLILYLEGGLSGQTLLNNVGILPPSAIML